MLGFVMIYQCPKCKEINNTSGFCDCKVKLKIIKAPIMVGRID